MKSGNILVVDDNRAVLTALNLLLPQHFRKVVLLDSTVSLLRTLADEHIDVVLLDMNFKAGLNSGNEGLFWLGEIKSACSDCEVVLFTAYADVNLAVEAVKRGAFDFVTKPFANAKLVSTLKAALRMSNSGRQVKSLREINRELLSSHYGGEFYWGESMLMKELADLVRKVAATDASVLITGENGTGKDVLAGEIHRCSMRRAEAMVKVDIASLPESLLESELFGHVKGAFTDAKCDRAGKFEAASGGSLFLDEIGNIPLHLQAKLLNVLQSRVVFKVGSNVPVSTNIRLISATNRDLSEMIFRGEFREDLLYRINTIHINIPPLRQRKCDIIPLALNFLRVYAERYGKSVKGITDSAGERLRDYSWKGNIRELQHVIERAVILSGGDMLRDNDFFFGASGGVRIGSGVGNGIGGGIGSCVGSGIGGGIGSCVGSGIGLGFAGANSSFAGMTLEQMEKQMIIDSISANGGNLSNVATELGISRQTLYNKIGKYRL